MKRIILINLILIIVFVITFKNSIYTQLPVINVNKNFKGDFPTRLSILPYSEDSPNDIKMSDLLTTELISFGFNIIERNQLNRILKEQGFTLSGFLESENREIVGKIANIDGIFIVSESDNRINIKLLDLATGIIILSGYVEYNPQERMDWYSGCKPSDDHSRWDCFQFGHQGGERRKVMKNLKASEIFVRSIILKIAIELVQNDRHFSSDKTNIEYLSDNNFNCKCKWIANHVEDSIFFVACYNIIKKKQGFLKKNPGFLRIFIKEDPVSTITLCNFSWEVDIRKKTSVFINNDDSLKKKYGIGK